MARVYEKGQVTLPKAVREQLDIRPNDEVIVEVRGNEIVIRKPVDIFNYKPPHTRRDVGLTDRQTTDIARDEHIRAKHGRNTVG